MRLPTISEYISSVSEPFGFLRTLPIFEAGRDVWGNVHMVAGNNAAVFTVLIGGEPYSLKCYIKPSPYRKTIYAYLETHPDGLLSAPRLLPDELYVYDMYGKGNYYDVVLAPWVEGATLETEICRACRERDVQRIKELSELFDAFAVELLNREWAHGDIKPDNIVVTPERKLVLIDCDAMFIPESGLGRAHETGTPQFQHPLRENGCFGKFIDDYPVALISVSLRALFRDISLYDDYNRGDNIVMYPSEIIEGRSGAYDRILGLFAGSGDLYSYNLATALRTDSPRIEGLQGMIKPDRPPHNTTPELFTENNLWGYSDDGRVIVPAVCEEAYSFSEGLAVVRIHGIWQVIDCSGATLYTLEDYTAVKPFSEGMAAVQRDGLWGYISVLGRMAIAPAYETAGKMHEGRAHIKTGGKYGYIDLSGNEVIPPVYDYATSYHDGKAMVCLDGKMFEIDYFNNKI